MHLLRDRMLELKSIDHGRRLWRNRRPLSTLNSEPSTTPHHHVGEVVCVTTAALTLGWFADMDVHKTQVSGRCSIAQSTRTGRVVGRLACLNGAWRGHHHLQRQPGVWLSRTQYLDIHTYIGTNEPCTCYGRVDGDTPASVNQRALYCLRRRYRTGAEAEAGCSFLSVGSPKGR